MIEKKLLLELKDSYQKNEIERKKIISASNEILFKAKKTIFAIQKDDKKSASLKFSEMENDLKKLFKNFGKNRLQKEGAFKAAAEEYMEAVIFFSIVNKKRISKHSDIELEYDTYLGGICDAVGELVRFATNKAAAGKFSYVAKMKAEAENIMEELTDFDMTGYLRTKYDQARGHLRKLEQMAYEIKLRSKK
jgi:predicted translin family RNA/ssDNA-binding protein